jgi:hypothetical protein
MHSFYCIQRERERERESRLQKMGTSNRLCIYVKITQKLYNIYFFQCLKTKSIIEELNTMIIALCNQTYVLYEENIMLGMIFV